MTQAALVTGYPNFVARRLITTLLDRGTSVYMLCKDGFEKGATQEFAHAGDQIRIVTGDVVNMDLGLSGMEIKEIRANVSTFYHLAGIYYLGSHDAEMELVNIEGTRNALAFAMEMPHLQRFLHYSTAFVAGSREGVMMEDDLSEPPRFRNSFERTKYLAERVVHRAMSDLPISIVRPSLIVGDSTTGEIEQTDGPFFFMQVLVNLPATLQIPLVGKGAFPLNLVPVDFVVKAIIHIANHPEAVGKTFHLTDSNPLPARAVLSLLCEAADKKPPKGFIPTNLATALLKMPGLEKHWRSPRLFLECLNQLVIYNAMNTTEILKGTDISCPPFPSYVGNLVTYLRRRRPKRK